MLDATRDELAPGIEWVGIHRARPRLPLRCPACGAGVHAKVSPAPRRLRYFAHDALDSNCALSGESLAHRLLKVELVHAIRAAGWDAQLEVPGDGWRADVLASDAASSRRMAWEAQLSGQTPDETVERTANLHRAGVAVCWVTDKRASWLGSAPGVRLQRDDDGLRVVEGHARLDAFWCEHRKRCANFDGGPCDGHGRWSTPDPILLPTFVGHVLRGQVRPHRATVKEWEKIGPWVWTTPAYQRLAAELTDAQDRRDDWRRQQEKRREEHERRILALLDRQEQLRRPVMDWMLRERGKQVVVADAERSPRWAMGVPVYFGQQVLGVICPVASRVDDVAHRLAGVTLFAQSSAERDRIVRASRRRLEVVVLPTAPTALEPA
ncbi:MAG: pSRTUE45b [Labilithrix sp.]|nr:pSRTUE45b [Labilithrix sp.]